MRRIAHLLRRAADAFDPPNEIFPIQSYPGSVAALAFAIREELPLGVVARYYSRRGVTEPGAINIIIEGP